MFCKFHYFVFFTPTFILSQSKFEYPTLKACFGSGFRQVLRSNEPPKVVISLMTSFKNQVFKQGASKTSPKPLLRSFWTARTLQNEAQERSQTHSRTLILVLLVLLEAHSSLQDTPKGLENGFCSDFDRYCIVFKLIYGSFGSILLSWIQIEVILEAQFTVVHTSRSITSRSRTITFLRATSDVLHQQKQHKTLQHEMQAKVSTC